jgi:uncharacterized membrane protein
MAFAPTHTFTDPNAAAVRKITEADLNWALAQGWKDFTAKRGDILVLALLYPLIGFLAAALAFDGRLLPLVFPLVAGLSIAGPAVAAGFYEIARRREEGLESSWFHFFDPLRGRSRAGLAVLTLGLAVLFVAWLAVAWMIAAITIGVSPSTGVGDFLRHVLTTSEGWSMIVLGNMAGLLFAAATLVLSLVSFPMVVDGAWDPVSAVLTSIRAARENPAATTSWGLRVAGLLALGCLPAFIGLAVVLPVLGYATWHLYTRVVVRR